MDFAIDHGLHSWKIENLRLFPAVHTVETSSFSFANALWVFSNKLQLDRAGSKFFISLELRRNVVDENSNRPKVVFKISIKSGTYILVDNMNEFDFVNGDNCRVIHFESTTHDFVSACENNKTLLIECFISCLLITDCSYSQSDIRPDLEDLSQDLMKLLNENENEFRDAYLVAEGTAIPVIVEILSAYSSVFRKEFGKLLPRKKRLQVPYSRAVVEALLEFLYTGLMRRVLDFPFKTGEHFDLFKCAEKYKIFELLKHFTVWKMETTSVGMSESSKFIWDVPQCNNSTVSELHFRKKISENIEIAIDLLICVQKKLFQFNIGLSKCDVLTDVGISMNLKIFDKSGVMRFKGNTEMRLLSAKQITTIIPKEENNLSSGNLVLTDPIRILCEFNVARLNISSVSSDLQYNYNREHLEDNNNSSLSKIMGYLLYRGFYNNVRLDSGPNGEFHLHVHISILYARCPELVHLLDDWPRNNILYLDIPSEIVEQLVFYIYTGRLLKRENVDFEALYKVAVKYKFTSLQNRCSQILRTNSSNKNDSLNVSCKQMQR